jgi:hypothetical protein
MTATSKPIVVKKKNGEIIKFHSVLQYDPAKVDDDMFHLITTDTLITDNLAPGSYIAISLDVAKKVVEDGQRDLIVFFEIYMPVVHTYWFKLRGEDSPVSLTKDVDSNIIKAYLTEFGDVMSSIIKFDKSIKAYAYAFILSR